MNSIKKFQSCVSEVINTLQDPYLVSAFQNYFGVYRVESFKNGDQPSASLSNGVGRKRIVEKPESADPISQVKDDSSEYQVESKLWYYVFSFGTSLGYEMFYASFFPLWVWNLNAAVCRRVVNVWVFVMYIGQALKDIICWPRPSSPPVIHLEPKYVVEYGMPSTHAMVSIALPFSFWYFTSQRYDISFSIGLLICLTWCILVCCSRLYRGMHTVLDVAAGLILAPVLMFLVLPFSDAIDYFQQHNPYSFLVTTSVMVFFQVLYPRTGRWSPARGDTSVIMGTGTGFALGTWLNHYLERNSAVPAPLPIALTWPDLHVLGLSVLRLIIGILCIVVARTIMKNLMNLILCTAMRLNSADIKCRRNPCVELPTKFVTYICVGLVITFLAPEVFRCLHIERESMYTEI